MADVVCLLLYAEAVECMSSAESVWYVGVSVILVDVNRPMCMWRVLWCA